MKKEILYSLITLLALAWCSTISQNDVFEDVKKKTGQTLQWIKTAQEARSVDNSVHDLLVQPLTQDNAIRIALINNRSLQQMYEQIGISHSDLVQAGLMSNPLLGYSIGRGGGSTTTTLSLDIAFLDLLWIPLRRELGGLALEETQFRVGDEVLKTVREVKKAYIDARMAHEKVALYATLLKSHEASMQLAIRQHTAGNLSKRNLLKMQDTYAHARLEVMDLSRESALAREALNRLLGVYGEQTNYTLEDTAGSHWRMDGLESRAIVIVWI
jgi:outer membrane protein TolC